MLIWKRLYNKLFKPINGIIYLFIVTSLLGFLDATFLTIEHLRGTLPYCNITLGCGPVLQSSYATIVNVPVALLGSIFYLSILLLSLFYVDSRKEWLLRLISHLTTLGFVASLYFLYLQAFVLHSFCQYCLGSAASSTLLFIMGMMVLHNRRLPV